MAGSDGRGALRPLVDAPEDSASLSDSDGDSEASAREDLLFRRAFAAAEQRQVQIVDLVLEDTEEEAGAAAIELDLGNDSERPDASAEDEDAAPFEAAPAPPDPIKPARKRLRSGGDKPNAAPVVTKPEPTECTICYDSCTITGRHRLVSLKCGHLFGKKCVERWVQERKTCPNCNAAVRKADIRPLFSDHVAVVDNSGVEDMKSKYEAEKSKRIQLETELSRSKLQLELQKAECERLKQEALSWKRELSQLQCQIVSDRFAAEATSGDKAKSPVARSRVIAGSAIGATMLSPSQPSASQVATTQQSSSQWSPSSRSPIMQPPAFTQIYQFPLKSSRVFAISRSCDTLCVGDAFSPTTHGLVKLSTVDSRHCARIAAHQMPVRDVKINTRGDLAVSVAFDGKLVVTNLLTHSIVMQYALPPQKRQGWACAFSDYDPFAIFCGFHDGTIAQYDLRKTSHAPDDLPTYTMPAKQPVHSIQSFKGADEIERLVATTFGGLGVWKIGAASSAAFTPELHMGAGSCCSLSKTQTKPNIVLVSSRTQANEAAKHSVFDLNQSQDPPTPVGVVTGHRTPPVLSRSAIWETRGGATIVASGDYESRQVLLWNLQTNRVAHRLPALADRQVVVDVQHSVAHGDWRHGRALCGVLGAQQLVLYKSPVL